jgi:hypothetical protein
MVTTKETKAKAPPEMSNTRRIATLVIGDALAFLIFAAIGRGSHGEATGLAAIPQIALTAAPFAAAWFIVAPFAGAYRRELTAQPRKMAIRTILAWVLSWPVAMALRGIFVDHAVPPISFALITLIFNTFILLIWRWPFALNNSIKKSSNP